MIKTLSAALIAASLMFAPGLSASADAAQPAAQPKTATPVKPVKFVKKTNKRHIAKGHKRIKHVKSVRHIKKHGIHKRVGKVVKGHKRVHASVAKPRVRAN